MSRLALVLVRIAFEAVLDPAEQNQQGRNANGEADEQLEDVVEIVPHLSDPSAGPTA